MGGDDAVGPVLLYLRQHSFCDSPAGGRLGAAAEFVDEHQRLLSGADYDFLEILQVGAVGTEVVLQRLVVADVDEYVVENHEFRHFGGRHQHAPLEHVLQQSDRLEADRLSAGVRAGDDQDAFGAVQMEIQRDDLLAFAGQSLLEDGVAGLAQPELSVLRNDRHSGYHIEGHKGLGADEIYLAEELSGLQQFGQIGAQELCELGEDAGYLGLLVLVKLVETVVHLHNLYRLDEDRLAAGALVVHYAGDAVLVDCRHRDEHLAVPHRHSGIFLHIAVALGLLEDGRRDF